MNNRTLAALAAILLAGVPAAGGRAAYPLALAPDASFLGAVGEDQLGTLVTGGGDLDGDGLDDLLIGAAFADGILADVGRVYVVFGRPGGWSLDMPLSSPDSSFQGETESDQLGASAAGLGDADGDGLDDLLIGAPGNDQGGAQAGKIYVIFGQPGGWGSYELAASVAGATLVGQATGDLAGASVAGPGDVNGDGLDDLWIGAPDADVGFASAGVAYLVTGRDSGWAPDMALALADASFAGAAAGEGAGRAVAGAGDVDGDGLRDLLVGAPDSSFAALGAGQVYLVLGRETGWMPGDSLASADASFVGEESLDHAGVALSGAGDVDGDGLDDLLIGARDHDGAGLDAGKAYLVLGRDSGWGMHIGLEFADASFGGGEGLDLAGRAVATGGDVDGDGLDDLLIGATRADDGNTPLDTGQAYLFLGRPAAEWLPGMSVHDANAVLDGVGVGDQLGRSLAFAGDVDGDGLDDLVVGAPGHDDGGPDTGQVSLVLGFPCDDLDQDGHAACWGDCDDGDDSVYPGAAETCGDGIDSDCDASVTDDLDQDGDGFSPCMGDCDDLDPARHPGAVEVCDELDDDCDGALTPDEIEDLDGDGSPVCADCDDADASTFPGAPEGCDGLDNDCDGSLPVGEQDQDGDGALGCAYDCDDSDPALNPHDFDSDGQSTCQADCDDADPAVFWGAAEVCGDGVDSNCYGDLLIELDDDGDGFAECEGDCDDADPTLYPADLDGDGQTPCSGDCDDSDPEIYLGADDPCGDRVDGDCLGDLWKELDDDGDGFSDCEGDCNDNDPEAYPGAEEICDARDTDCDGKTDAEEDQDHDGHTLCGPDGHPSFDDDCDDHHPAIHPGAPELCDGLDNNCNGSVDDGFDLDGDGYASCNGLDCDDAPATGTTIHPGAPEIPYDGIDQDCSGGDLIDVDGDGVPGGPWGSDCDDLRASIHPGATENCTDGLDNDCDGVPDSDEPECAGAGCTCRVDRPGPPSAAAALLLLGLWVARRRTG